MTTHIIDGEEYEECSVKKAEVSIYIDKDNSFMYLSKVKKKIEFPVRVELSNNFRYCLIFKDGEIRCFYGDRDKCSVIKKEDLQKINEKMKELEEQGAFE